MKLSSKAFTYLISALCIASLLALAIFGLVFANAFDLQMEKMTELRLINSKLAAENSYLQEKISQLEGVGVKDAVDPAARQENSSNTGGSEDISSNDKHPQAAYVHQQTTGSDPAKTAYLTFNGGPSASTGKILDILKRHQVKAAFFVVGTTNAAEQELYRRIVAEGHTIGNLTYSHDFFYIYASEANFIEDFNKLQELIQKETGVTPQVYRLPGDAETAKRLLTGQFFQSLSSKLMSKGYIAVDWNINSQDAGKFRVTKEEVVKTVLSQAEGKSEAVILFHDSSVKTAAVEALPEIIQELTNKGFTFKAVTPTSIKVNL
jgi:peptidoglycan/xylan/chitin deacetylase (PgdA/CDA1 family)